MKLGIPKLGAWVCVLGIGSAACTLRDKADADAVAASCGGTCPAGTWRDEVRSSRSGSQTYVDFVEGSCSWSCVAVSECPEDTVPVITSDCFTCASAMPGGSLAGGACDPDDWFDNRTDAPDGQVDTIEIGGSAEADESVRFEDLTFVDAVSVGFQPRGLAAWGDKLYVGDHGAGLVHIFDTDTMSELGTIDVGFINPDDMAVSETTLWLVRYGIYAFDLDSGEHVGTDDDERWEGGITYDGTHLLAVWNDRLVYHDPLTLNYYDEVALNTPFVGPAAWGPRRLLGADVAETSPRVWRFPIYDLTGEPPVPLASVLSIELDASPVHGMAVSGDRMYVTGAFYGDLAEKIVVLSIQ